MLHPIDWSIALPYYAAAVVFGYLLGSVPFGLIVTRLAGTTDIRGIGSGNIGATNVLRTGRKGLAAATVTFDILKGTAAVLVAVRWGREYALVAGLGAFIGHLFPVWLKFKGGKGVATFVGVLIGLAWPVTLAFAALFLGVAALSRYVSLASILACAATPLILWFTGDALAAQLFLLMAIIVIVMHRQNIERLIAGTESRIGQKAPPGAAP